MKHLLTCIFISLLHISTNAQTRCATHDIPIEEWIYQMESIGGRPTKNSPRPRNGITIPIHYHIVRKTNGTDGFPLHYVFEMHCDLNKNYAKNNTDIQFAIDTISYINSDNLFQVTTNQEEAALNLYNTPNHCNVYLVDDPKGACGYTYRLGLFNSISRRAAIYVKASRLNVNCSAPRSTTLSHEMGHWLDLPHTFNGWEGRTYNTAQAPANNLRENVARTGTSANCDIRADGFCDTDPDYISDRWQCPNNSNYIDPLGVSFKHKGDNYMCYSSDECTSTFSEEQKAQMNYFYRNANDRRDLLSGYTPNATLISDSMRQFFPVGSNSTTRRIPMFNAEVSWKAIPNAKKYVITVGIGTGAYNASFNFTNLNIIFDTIVYSNSVVLPSRLFSSVPTNNTYYYYNIRAVNEISACGSNLLSPQAFRVTRTNIGFIKKDVSCFGGSDGSITMVDSPSLAISAFKLNNDSISGKLKSDLSAGQYTIGVKASASETVEISTTLFEPTEIIASATSSGKNANGFASGGVPPYTYNWSNGSTNKQLTNLSNGTYTLTVIDANGCESSKPASAKISVSTVSINSGQTDEFVIYPTKLHYGETMKLSMSLVDASLNIYGLDGKLLQSYHRIGTTEMPWSISQKGIYLIEIKSDKYQKVFKVESY